MYYDDYRLTPNYDEDPTISDGDPIREAVGRQAAGETGGGGQRTRRAPRPPRRKRRWGRTVAGVCLCAFLFGGIAGLTFQGTTAALAGTSSGTAVSLSGAAVTQLASSNAGSLNVTGIAKASLPSIVSVTNQTVREVRDLYSWFYGFGYGGSPARTQESTSVGSGILIRQTEDWLYIVTNYHVIDGATNLSATFADGQTCQAELVGGDETNDVAVIRVPLSAVPASTLSAVQVAAVGDSDALEVGEQVVAIGNALGYGQSVTTGVVSALDRTLGDETGAAYIQTDAAINPGNSGGALLNMNGEVVGINTAKLSSTEVEGMGYAIPMARAAEIVNAILADTGGAL